MAAALLNWRMHWPFFIRVGPQAFRATRRIGQSKLRVNGSLTEVTRHRNDTDSSSRASAQEGFGSRPKVRLDQRYSVAGLERNARSCGHAENFRFLGKALELSETEAFKVQP